MRRLFSDIRILVVGPGGCGKDTFGKMLAEESGLIYAGSMSETIAEDFARGRGTTKEYEMAHRHDNRQEWFERGNLLRKDDPCALLRAGFARGNILTGARNKQEIEMGAGWHYDVAIWVNRNGVEIDPTLEYGYLDIPPHRRICVQNNGPLMHLKAKLPVVIGTLKSVFGATA